MKVIPGVFIMCDTHGLPLEDAIFEADQQGVAIDWVNYIEDARKHGWSEKTIRTKITYAVQKVHGRDYLLEFNKRLDLVVAPI